LTSREAPTNYDTNATGANTERIVKKASLVKKAENNLDLGSKLLGDFS
jgi:hypothetical protein